MLNFAISPLLFNCCVWFHRSNLMTEEIRNKASPVHKPNPGISNSELTGLSLLPTASLVSFPIL